MSLARQALLQDEDDEEEYDSEVDYEDLLGLDEEQLQPVP